AFRFVHRDSPVLRAWRLTTRSFLDGPPEMSNFCCLPGKAGGFPILLKYERDTEKGKVFRASARIGTTPSLPEGTHPKPSSLHLITPLQPEALTSIADAKPSTQKHGSHQNKTRHNPMKQFSFFVTLTLLSVSAVASDLPDWMNKDGWVSYEAVCQSMNKKTGSKTDCSEGALATGDSLFSSWAGETMKMYYEKSSNSFTKIRIRVTWTTDRSPYKCGETITMRPDEIKDFTHRSLAMTQCR
uniref:hypothetical protein n=1 Tax=uncultured Thiodictyon sp. TaxID=1846217 RepID=UPI0025D70465